MDRVGSGRVVGRKSWLSQGASRPPSRSKVPVPQQTAEREVPLTNAMVLWSSPTIITMKSP